MTALIVGRLRHRPQSWTLRLAFAVCMVVSVPIMLSYSTGRGTPFGDFDKAYYPAGRLVLSDTARLYDCIHRDGLCYVNIPIVAAMFTPISVLPLDTAHLVINVIGGAAIVLATWWLIVLTDATGWRRYAIVALVVLNGPLSYSVRLGNMTHVVLAMMVMAVLWLLRERDARAGTMLALCAIIKPPLLIWLPYFVIRGRWRAAAGMVGCLLAMVGASVALFGVELHALFLQKFIFGQSAQPIGAYNVQSINGFLVRLTTSGGLVNWQPVAVGPGFRLAQIAIAAGIVGMAITAGLAAGPPRTLTARLREYSVVLALMLAFSPISWTHYYCFLLLPMAAYAAGALRVPRSPLWVGAALLTALLVSLPVALWLPSSPAILGAVIARILLSHYFFGAVLLLMIATVLALREGRFSLGERQRQLSWVHNHAPGS